MPRTKPYLKKNGWCPCCQSDTYFISIYSWLRDHYKCTQCGSIPRERLLHNVLNFEIPNWKYLDIHESSPSNDLIKTGASNYTASQYFPEYNLGEIVFGFRNENLEALTLAGGSIDLFIHLDVLEHLFHPGHAIKEMLRVIKNRGVIAFTVPIKKELKYSKPRALMYNERAVFLEEPEYHGNPVGDGRSLVTWDYGEDFMTLLLRWCDNVNIKIIHHNTPIPEYGVEGEFLDVFLIRKEIDYKVFVHLGDHCTGAPTIQKYLDINQEILSEKGYIYPKTPSDQYLMTKELNETFDIDNIGKYTQIIFDEILSSMRNKIIFSSEGLLDKQFQANALQSCLSKYLIYFDIEIIYYCRRQDDLLEALYSERVKKNFMTLSLDDFINSGSSVKYASHIHDISGFEDTFGKNCVAIRAYDQERMHSNNIFSDFLNAIECETTGSVILPDRSEADVRLSKKYLEIQRIFNKYIIGMEDTNPFSDCLEKFNIKGQGGESNLPINWKPTQIKKFSKMNKDFANTYLDLEGDHDFNELEIEEQVEESSIKDDIGFEEITNFFSSIISEVYTQISTLKNELKKMHILLANNLPSKHSILDNKVKSEEKNISLETMYFPSLSQLKEDIVCFNSAYMEKPYISQEGIVIETTGNKPYVVLDISRLDFDFQYLFTLEMHSPCDTTLDINWMTRHESTFSPIRSITLPILKGNNIKSVCLPSDFDGPLRMDFGNHPGRFLIKKIKMFTF